MGVGGGGVVDDELGVGVVVECVGSEQQSMQSSLSLLISH